MSHTIDPSTVATMQGRELDDAVHRHVMGNPYKQDWRFDGVNFDIVRESPRYSTDPAAFFAMVETVRAKGWNYKMWDGGYVRSHKVELFFTENGDVARRVLGEANTLPLAFARAALLACLMEPAK